MIKKLLAIALAAGSMGAAHATLANLGVWDTNAQIISQNLVGVQFNTTTAGDMFVSLGAHPYINGVTMANDGTNFFAPSGVSTNHPNGENRANWSFDFAFDVGACASCNVFLIINGTDFQIQGGNAPFTDINAGNGTWLESWNLLMPFLSFANYNPNMPNSTSLALEIRDGTAVLARTAERVDVPEPGSLALVGLALAGLGFMRRRKA